MYTQMIDASHAMKALLHKWSYSIHLGNDKLHCFEKLQCPVSNPQWYDNQIKSEETDNEQNDWNNNIYNDDAMNLLVFGLNFALHSKN